MSSTCKGVVHDLSSCPKPSPDYPPTFPSSMSSCAFKAPSQSSRFITPYSRAADENSGAPNPSSSSRSVLKTAPPSRPLPSLPLEAESKPKTTGDPRKLLATRHKSFEETRTSLSSVADVARNSGLLHTSLSLSTPMGETRKLVPITHDQLVESEIEEKSIPTSAPLPQGKLADPPSLYQPQSKSGLLKRLKMRLAGSRSSPSLRPVAVSFKESPKDISSETVQYSREHTKLSANANAVPARLNLPVPDDKSKVPVKSQQSLNARLSFGALQERRAEKREARVREEQYATNARRAAALAKTGLLPASRRYSIVALPGNGGDSGCLRPPPFDPFARDQTQHDEGSGDRVAIEDSAHSRKEGRLTAAEIIIREWKERNAPVIEQTSTSPSEDANDGVEPREAKAAVKPTTPRSSVVRLQSVDSVLVAERGIPSECSPETAPKEGDCRRSVMNSLIPAKETLVRGVPPSSHPTTKGNQRECMLPPQPPSKASRVSQGSFGYFEGLDATRESEPEVPDKRKVETEAEAEICRDILERKDVLGEKVALSHWCFPASVPPKADPLKTPIQGGEDHVVTHSTSSESSETGSSRMSTTTLSRRVRLSSRLDDSLPIRPLELAGKGRELHTNEPLSARPQLPPSQVLRPPSPGSSVPHSPRSRQRSSTAPSVSSHCSRTQKSSNVPVVPVPTLTVSLPALSPTTSTDTATSGGSTLPRTPSTSSHGHGPVRVLDVPLEVEEDVLLPHEHTALPSIVELRPKVELTGVKEFGQLARLADLDPERFDNGALPPFPPTVSRDSSIGGTASPTSELDRRKRATLFGRRRTTHNDPPMISIPEHNLPATKVDKPSQNEDLSEQHPRHVSSFTNLRRTVTYVTVGIAGAALRSSRDRSPLHQATESSPRPPTSLHSDESGGNSLSPTCAVASTPNQRNTRIGLRPRPLNPTMHSRGSILMETHAIEDVESRRLAELAFLD